MKSFCLILVMFVISPAFPVRDWEKGENPWDHYRTVEHLKVNLALEPIKAGLPARLLLQQQIGDVIGIVEEDIDLKGTRFVPERGSCFRQFDLLRLAGSEVVTTTRGGRRYFTYIFSSLEMGRLDSLGLIERSCRSRLEIGNFNQKNPELEIKIIESGMKTRCFAWNKAKQQYTEISANISAEISFYCCRRFMSREFETTLTELIAIAAAAMAGESSQPVLL